MRHDNCRDRCLRPIDITVAPGTQVTIAVPEVFLHKGRCYTLNFCLTRPEIVKYSTIIGTETVFIQNGVGGDLHQMLDNAADIFYGEKLLRGFCYRLRFGNNGLPSSVTHFLNLNTPCCGRDYNPNNANDGPTGPAGDSETEA